MKFTLNKYYTCICSAQSKNWDNSGIVLRKVRILTLPGEVEILTLHKTVPEFLLRKVGNEDKVRISIVVHLFVISVGVCGHIKHYRIYTKY